MVRDSSRGLLAYYPTCCYPMSMDIRAKVVPCLCWWGFTLPHYMLLVNGAAVKTLSETELSRALDDARLFLSGVPPLAATP